MMAYASHIYALWVYAVSGLSMQLVTGTLLLVLSGIFGNDVGLEVALLFCTLLTFGVQSLYVVQQSNIIHYAPEGHRTSLLLLERAFQETGTIIAILTTAFVWDSVAYEGICVFSAVWIAATALESFVILLYKTDPTGKTPL